MNVIGLVKLQNINKSIGDSKLLNKTQFNNINYNLLIFYFIFILFLLYIYIFI